MIHNRQNSLIKSNKYDINYKDPINQQTLLSLAIVNHKKNAFLKLLRLGADPNLIIGQLEDSSALSEAIKMSQKWKMFYIANLLKNKANPNLLIIPKSQNYFSDYYPIFTAIVYSDNYDVIQLLVNYGADINVCNPHSISNVYCDGVLQNCLDQKKMLLLRYFIIEAKIKIPKIVYFKGGFDEKKQKEFSLTEILNTEEYKFEDFEEDGAKTDFSEYRRYRLEIIQYLKKTRQY